MADPFDTPGYRYSVNRFPGDGATTTWNISFAGMSGSYAGYISTTHVKAYTIEDATGAETPLPIPGTAWIGPTTLKIEPAVPVGHTLVVYRDTPKNAPLLDYVDGALIIEKNLDTSNQQSVYAVAEMVDRFADALEDMEEFTLALLDKMAEVEGVSNDAHDIAEEALSTANSAKDASDQAVITSGQALAGVTGAQEAAILATTAANNANSAAGLATTAANNANQAALDALQVSGEARDTANDAKDIAEGIDGKATTALNNANDAVNTANGIDSKATSALSTAEDAKDTADAAALAADAATLAAASAAQKSANLSDLADAATARSNLGLGGAATLSVGTAAGTVAAGNDARITGALQAANNLSDISNAVTARANLGVPEVADLQWLGAPVGVELPFHPSAPLPPTDNPDFRYIVLTAGLAGSGQYNEGVLTSETVTGSDPTITATAEVSLAGSPLNGQTIDLINTSRVFLRPGPAAGAIVDSKIKAHTHGIPNLASSGSGFNSTTAGSGSITYATTQSGAYGSDTETAPRYIPRVYLMRIL